VNLIYIIKCHSPLINKGGIDLKHLYAEINSLIIHLMYC